MDLKEVVCKGVGWIHLAEDRVQWWTLVNTVLNIQDPQKAGSIFASLATISLSGMTWFHGINQLF
jgi:hypothetical protein